MLMRGKKTQYTLGSALLGGCAGCPLCGGILKLSELDEPDEGVPAQLIYSDKFYADSAVDSWKLGEHVPVSLKDLETYMEDVAQYDDAGSLALYKKLSLIRNNMKDKDASYHLARHKSKNGEDYVSFVKDRTRTASMISTTDKNFGCRQQTITRKKPNKKGELASYTRYYKDGVIVGPDLCNKGPYKEYKKMQKPPKQPKQQKIAEVLPRAGPSVNPKYRIVITTSKTGKKTARCREGKRFTQKSNCTELGPLKYSNTPSSMFEEIIYKIYKPKSNTYAYMYNKKFISKAESERLKRSGIQELDYRGLGE